jgi:hypothetical protein
MYLYMHLPLIVTLVITLLLDQVLQAVVTHLAIQYSLDLILLLTVNESWGWGWCRSLAKDGIRKCGGQFDDGENGVMFHKCLTPKSVTIRSYKQQK